MKVETVEGVPERVPPPEEVIVTLTWNEFLYLHAALGTTNEADNVQAANKQADSASSWFDCKRDPADLRVSKGEDWFRIYKEMHRVFTGNTGPRPASGFPF